MSSLLQVQPQLPVLIDLGSTYGALFIGCMFASLLFGLTSIQAYVYFRTHTGRWTKFYRFIVLLLWTLDAVHLALTIHCVYYYLVTNFANFEALVTIVWSFKLQIVVNVVTVHVIHLLYSHRIWIVGRDRSKIFRIIPGTVVVLSLGMAIALFWIVYHHNQSTGMFLDRWPSFMAMSVATVLDIVITSSLWYLLASSRTGFSYTDCFIRRLMCYTVNSGCLTSICSLVSIITCAVMPHNFIFFSIQFLTAKLYVSSYIALLNTKYYMQPNADTTDTFELRREPPSPGPRDTLQEKFPLLRKSFLTHSEVDAVPPTRPLSVITSRKSVLMTGEKGSFIDV
ncbi:hypothetical protein P692DRAFT_201780179 [Suillus brevipes Sb2]|nr:hypothetical protein P692DRAFT_201780179 [Suillus brevipes Sb2]